MKMATSRCGPLRPDEIERINAYGPYNHAVWSAGEMRITHEEQLQGRGEFLVQRIRECLTSRFRPEELRTMSILDIGCYDGWILHQLSDLPFARMVGVEPRERNLRKGQVIREILGLSTRVEFRVGDLESLGQEPFDIVLCTGVLHHVESPAAALRRLHAVCRRLLILETICLSSRHLTKAAQTELELKDLVYGYKPRLCGLSGQKFESSYSDGSTITLGVVSIPSLESLRMYLDVVGFEEVTILADPASYRAAVWRDRRDCQAVCLCAAVKPMTVSGADEAAWIRDYESRLASTVLDRAWLEPLYGRWCLAQRPSRLPWLARLIDWYLRAPTWLAAWLRRGWLIQQLGDPSVQEIVKNLRFNPPDKLRLEYAKWLSREGKDDEAIAVLRGITEKLNADWRSVYRAFDLLAQLHAQAGRLAEARRYARLGEVCNPRYPHGGPQAPARAAKEPTSSVPCLMADRVRTSS